MCVHQNIAWLLLSATAPRKGKDMGKKHIRERKTAELVFVLDRSGSMSGLEEDTIAGFNTMLKKQKGEVNVTTVLFADELEELYFRKRIDDVSEMTDKEYFVQGTTALLDVIGKTIHKMILSEKKQEEKNKGPVIFVIITDGYENASRVYTYESVKKLIEKQKKSGWEFLFLGANMDAVREAGNFGISSDRAVAFHNDKQGVALNYKVVGNTLSFMRMERTMPMDSSWKDEIEKDYKKRK